MVSHHSNRNFCQIYDGENNFQLDYIESFESRARRRRKKSRSQSHKKNVKIINPILISILLPQLAFIQRNFVHPLFAGFVRWFLCGRSRALTSFYKVRPETCECWVFLHACVFVGKTRSLSENMPQNGNGSGENTIKTVLNYLLFSPNSVSTRTHTQGLFT